MFCVRSEEVCLTDRTPDQGMKMHDVIGIVNALSDAGRPDARWVLLGHPRAEGLTRLRTHERLKT